jgi:hypothetical protein
MRAFIRIGGYRLYIERAEHADDGPWFERVTEGGETLVWFGRWHVIATPPRWRPSRARREVAVDRGASAA